MSVGKYRMEIRNVNTYYDFLPHLSCLAFTVHPAPHLTFGSHPSCDIVRRCLRLGFVLEQICIYSTLAIHTDSAKRQTNEKNHLHPCKPATLNSPSGTPSANRFARIARVFLSSGLRFLPSLSKPRLTPPRV